jgi:16S rRNA (uracil1498-N3)-methyltransferase
MPRIYLPISHIKDNRISITDEKAHHLTSVLRCRKGDELIVFDGKGNCFRTTILKADRREVIADVIKIFPCDTESHINITLVQGILKGEKMDIIIQKTTELGVNEIIPVVTERSQLRETRKLTRWRKIAEEGSRQSGRSVVPVIREPVEFKKYFANHDPKYKFHGFVFFEEDGMKLLEAVEKIRMQDTGYKIHDTKKSNLSQNHASCIMYHVSSQFYLFIGPEGGFTKEEITLTTERGLHVISLGKRILRAETAAISAMTLIQYLLGDMN